MPLIRSESQVTGDGGERLFCSGVPHSWLPEKQTSDYGIDYAVRVPEAHLVTGIHFGAQVKTTQRHPRAAGAVRVEIEVRHLSYWLDDQVPPVFLVACDLADRALYFVDVDDLVPALPPEWREQKTVTVSVPLINSVADHDRFLPAVRKAWERRMGPQAAVIRRQKEMQQVDPRFLIRITASADGELHEIIAREDVTTALRFEVPIADRERIDRLLRGHRVEFKPGEAFMTDMPLLRALHESGGSVQIAERIAAAVSLLAKKGEREATVRNIPTSIIRALRSIRFESRLPGTPLSVDLEIEVTKATEQGDADDRLPVKFGVALDASAWFGRKLADLPQFAALRDFIALCHDEASVRVVVHLPGQDIHLGEHHLPPGSFSDPWEYVEFIRLAREASADAGINPILPSSLSARQTEEVRRVHALLFAGEYRAPGKNWTFSVTGRAESGIARAKGEIGARMIGPPHDLPFLGTTVPIHTREVKFTRAVLTRKRKNKEGDTVFTFDSDGEFIERSDRYTAFDWTTP